MTAVPKYPVRGLVAPDAPMSSVLSGVASKKPEELTLKQLAVPPRACLIGVIATGMWTGFGAYLGMPYANLGESGLANENMQKAFELRERASEHERYRISAIYYSYVTGELQKANEVFEQWAQAYPRDVMPPFLALNLASLGQYDQALHETLATIRLDPDNASAYGNLVGSYATMNRLDEAKATYQKAMARQVESPGLHANRYYVAFLEADAAEMQRQVAWPQGKPGAEDYLLSSHSDTEAYFGHLVKAKELSRMAADAAKRNHQKETAAQWLLNAALRDTEVGDTALAPRKATAALALAPTQDVQILTALVLARAGATSHAQTIADHLHKRSPYNTVLNGYWLPTIRGSIALNRKDPIEAVGLLQAASAYELGIPYPEAQIMGTLYPVYVRGEAYLHAAQGQQAAVEFQKLISHRTYVGNFVLGALAHLQLGRAKAMSGDKNGARKAYQDFLILWKDADTDIPILKQAKAEYANLQ